MTPLRIATVSLSFATLLLGACSPSKNMPRVATPPAAPRNPPLAKS